MMLPPLAGRIATPAGLRGYPKEPELTDTAGERSDPPTATRVEIVTYVIEAPGSYTLPAISLDWWNTGSRSVATATTDAIAFDVAAPPGWKETPAGEPTRARATRIAVSLAALAAIAASVLLRRWRTGSGSPHPPSERQVYRRLRRTVRTAPAGALRAGIRDWMRRASPDDPALTPDIEAALLSLERSAYGSAGSLGSIQAAERRALLTALQDRRTALRSRKSDTGGRDLPALNPSPTT